MDTTTASGVLRWLSNDPIGIRGGLNQYASVRNNPVNLVDPQGLDAYMILKSPDTVYWAVDTSNGGVAIFHYSGASWGTGSGQWKVFFIDQGQVDYYADPTVFIQKNFPNMPPTVASVRMLANRWWNVRYKTTCDEDSKLFQSFMNAYLNQASLKYNAFGVFPSCPNCYSFGNNIISGVIGWYGVAAGTDSWGTFP